MDSPVPKVNRQLMLMLVVSHYLEREVHVVLLPGFLSVFTRWVYVSLNLTKIALLPFLYTYHEY